MFKGLNPQHNTLLPPVCHSWWGRLFLRKVSIRWSMFTLYSGNLDCVLAVTVLIILWVLVWFKLSLNNGWWVVKTELLTFDTWVGVYSWVWGWQKSIWIMWCRYTVSHMKWLLNFYHLQIILTWTVLWIPTRSQISQGSSALPGPMSPASLSSSSSVLSAWIFSSSASQFSFAGWQRQI